ncbi:MAG: hypothetical protein ACRC20_03715 [Segniliparus sp.]|uniref:hypothetical protein n=1 Tax=Segniliparus sp. TaxID=2804064 RepID=UPI003F4014E5
MSGRDPDFRITEADKTHIRNAFEALLSKLKGPRRDQAKDLATLPWMGDGFGACPDGEHLLTTAKTSGTKAEKYVHDLTNAIEKFRDATFEVWAAYERTDEGSGEAITQALAKLDAAEKLVPRGFATTISSRAHIVGFE